MYHQIKSVLIACLIAVMIFNPGLAYGDLPDLGDVSSESLSEQDARRISDAVYMQLRRSGDLLDDAEVQAYLSRLGARLVKASDAERYNFRFFPILDSSINAFAVPGGFVGVNTGLLVAAQHESEVAAVLAHEIAHVTQQHAARMQFSQRSTPWMILASLALGILAARSGHGDAAMAAMVGGQGLVIQNQLTFSQTLEAEADRIGMQTLKKSGFDPAAMPVFFGRLIQKERYVTNAAPAFLRTHPVTSKRISESEDRLGDYTYKQVPDGTDFLLIREKARVLQMPGSEAVRLYRSALADKRYASLAAQYYGLAFAEYRNNEFPQALQNVRNARAATKGGNALLDNLEGLILARQGKTDEALDVLRRGYAVHPESRSLLYSMLDSLLHANRVPEAVKKVQPLIELYPSDPNLYQLAARAYAALGNEQKQYQMQSEYYARHLDFGPAIDMMQRALAQKGGNFYTLSAMEARLKELQQLDQSHK